MLPLVLANLIDRHNVRMRQTRYCFRFRLRGSGPVPCHNLGGALEMNWKEVLRVAELPEYRNVEECKTLVREVANELKVKYPFDSD